MLGAYSPMTSCFEVYCDNYTVQCTARPAASRRAFLRCCIPRAPIPVLPPSLTLAAGRGYTATDLASLFTGPNIFWSVAGNATQPLFDGFNLLHLERAAVALYEQAAWNYRNTVVGAFQNVADSLRAIQNDADALKASRDFDKAAKVSLDLAQQQMQTGNANVLLLLNAEVTYKNAVIQVVQAQANRVSDTAALYQARGCELRATSGAGTKTRRRDRPIPAGSPQQQLARRLVGKPPQLDGGPAMPARLHLDVRPGRYGPQRYPGAHCQCRTNC
jgi:hypothetical protein